MPCKIYTANKYWNAWSEKRNWTQKADTHLQYFDNRFLIVRYVNSLKYFTILPTAKFSHQLVIILVTVAKQKDKQVLFLDCLQHAEHLSISIHGWLVKDNKGKYSATNVFGLQFNIPLPLRTTSSPCPPTYLYHRHAETSRTSLVQFIFPRNRRFTLLS